MLIIHAVLSQFGFEIYELGYPAAPPPRAPPDGAVDGVAHLEEVCILPPHVCRGVVDGVELAGLDMRPLGAHASHGAYRYARYRSSIYARYDIRYARGAMVRA